MRKIYPRFFQACRHLKNVNFDLKKVKCMPVGENGAGKSTLMKILGGVHLADEGEIELNGKNCPNIESKGCP